MTFGTTLVLGAEKTETQADVDLENLDERDHLGEPGVDGILILKRNLNGKKFSEPQTPSSVPG